MEVYLTSKGGYKAILVGRPVVIWALKSYQHFQLWAVRLSFVASPHLIGDSLSFQLNGDDLAALWLLANKDKQFKNFLTITEEYYETKINAL